MIDIDSPESLDEVFWRIFCGEEYIEETHLKPHSPQADVIWKYIRYVNAILFAQGGGANRYISKNNNNILRLNSIRNAFPQALILIPFRDPVTHAASLFRMHRKFVDMQNSDRFINSYMTWLAHHEFGLTHRPFWFHQNGADHKYSHNSEVFDYWLDTWLTTYEWLEQTAPHDAIFVCYEDLCTDDEVWNQLAKIAGVSRPAKELEALSLSSKSVGDEANSELMQKAFTMYKRLVDRGRAALR